MNKSLNVSLSAEMVDLMADSIQGKSLEDNLKTILAISFYVTNTVSLAKASELAGMSLSEFIQVLQLKGVPWSEYTKSEMEADNTTIDLLLNEGSSRYDKNCL